jgi:transcriptional regulator GlxA family with amidase domain
LSEALFIQAVRTFISITMDRETGLLGALQDSQIGLALKLIYHQPTEPWTVDSLANQVGMSRTAFSTKFRQLVGEPPLRYVTGRRLNKATVYLRTSTKKLGEIAELVGYASEVSFSKAFKRHLGVTPDAYRRSA